MSSNITAIGMLARRLAPAFGAAAASLLLASTAGAQSLGFSFAGGVPFPDRTLLVAAPPGPPLTDARVHVLENGAAVGGVQVTPLSHANAGDFGVVVVIDTDPSMGGTVGANALAAARSLAAQRSGLQQLGVDYTAGPNGTVALPLTTDPLAIQHALATGPHVGLGAHLLHTVASAVKQLTDARIAAGAVILVSDDIDPEAGVTPQAVAALASAAHVRLYAIGVHDRAFTPQSMGLLAQAGGGQFFQANPSEVSGIFTRIQSALTSQYAIHYRSSQRRGTTVAVKVLLDGVFGQYTTSYVTPSPAKAPKPNKQSQPFWSSSLALVFVAAGCALLFGIALVLVLSQFAERRGGVTARVGEFVTPPVAATESSSAVVAAAALGRTERALTTRSWWPAFVEDVDIARMGRSPVELVYLAVIGSFVAAALLILLSGSLLLGVPALIAGPILLRVLVNYRVRQQQALFVEQLPSHLEEVAAAMRSGRSLVEALGVVSESSEDPTRTEFDRALADERLGLPIEDTLRPIATRMSADGVEQLAVVAAMHRRTGSNVAEVLDRIAEGARESAELKRELSALTAQGRLARWILTSLPPVVLLAFAVIDPSYEHPLFNTTGGLASLVIGALMVVMGSYVMKRIVDIEV